MKIKLHNIMSKGKSTILACDQGMEHGPQDFNLRNIDPHFIMDLALEGQFNAVAVHAGIAEKYYGLHYKDVPLLLKLNGKTRYDTQDPWSRQFTSVDYAAKLGAQALGYTIYLGSKTQNEQFVEFGKICEQAHQIGLPVVLWNYPRGSHVQEPMATDTIAYGARIGLELGADMIKLKYNGDQEGFKWILKNAGKVPVVISGGSKVDSRTFLSHLRKIIDLGGSGVAVGRNAWQHEQPLKFAKAMYDVIHRNRSVDEAMKHLE